MPSAVSGQKNHQIVMNGRSEVSVSGVEDVISFDENCVVLKTVCGILAIDGSELHVVSLKTDEGDVILQGNVNGMIYPQNAINTSGGLFGRRRRTEKRN